MAERRSAAGEGLARLSEWADGHLGLLRNLSVGLAAAGLLVLARSVRLTTKFTNALDIPVEFVEKNVKLRGKIHHVSEKGLEVEHIPISIPIITSIQRKYGKQDEEILRRELQKELANTEFYYCDMFLAAKAPKHTGQSKGLLLVRLAGVELAPSGMVWLQKELKPSQMIWFQLLGRKDLALECRVLVNKGRFLSVCLNEEILRQGLGRTARIEGLHHDSRLYWKLHKRLLRAELKALKKNKGIWKEESFSERVRDRISNNKFVQTLKQFVNWLRIYI